METTSLAQRRNGKMVALGMETGIEAMKVQNLTLTEICALCDALADLIGYVTDESCDDPDCCGGPFYTVEEFHAAAETLAHYGLKWDGSAQSH